jgi:murein DD-endopeptidase MepM/ murein hydrolase activator NlpD
MANEFYTLIVVPHAKARFRRIQIPLRFAKWTLGTIAVALLTLTGVLVHYSRLASEVYAARQLRVENQALLTKTLEYEQNAGRLQAQVKSLQSVVSKLGVMAGLDHSLPDTVNVGVGGATGMESGAPRLEPGSFVAMEKNLNALADRSAQLEEFYRDQSVLLSSTPSIWPVRGYLSAGFGNRLDPFTGQKDFHAGIDISTPIGTHIQAPAAGVVISAGAQGAYGNALVIDHGYGVVTRYGHMEGFAAKPGQRVRRGDLLGYVGNTGRSTGPHLHYEVWVRDQAQNPIHFILDEYRSFS